MTVTSAYTGESRAIVKFRRKWVIFDYEHLQEGSATIVEAMRTDLCPPYDFHVTAQFLRDTGVSLDKLYRENPVLCRAHLKDCVAEALKRVQDFLHDNKALTAAKEIMADLGTDAPIELRNLLETVIATLESV